MKKLVPYLCFCLILAGCGPLQKDTESNEQTAETAKDTAIAIDPSTGKLNIQTRDFSEIDSSGILMFPLSFNEYGRKGSKVYSGESPATGYWNIVFLNSKTNEYQLLSEKKMLIHSFQLNEGSHGSLGNDRNNRFIFYAIATDDFNADGNLSNNDPQYLFVSDRTGNQLRQLSPPGHDLQHWQFFPATSKVIFIAARDSDQDKGFSDKDELVSFEFDLEKGSGPREIFSFEFQNKLKSLYKRDWEMKEN